jgi:ketosteroid isomerase-like protein
MVNLLVAELTPDAEAVLRFHEALERKDFEALRALWTPDARHEAPYALGPRSLSGPDEIVADYRKMLANRRDLEFTVQEIFDDSKGHVVVEFSGRSIVGETGGLYEQVYIAVFEIRGGRISRMRIYADSARAAALRSLRE